MASFLYSTAIYGNSIYSNGTFATTSYSVSAGLNWTTPVLLNITKTFIPNITGDVERILTVNYNLNGATIQAGLAYNETFDFKFTSFGPFTLTQEIIYNNGSNVVTLSQDFTITLKPTAIIVYDETENCDVMYGISFESRSGGGTPPISSYEWEVLYGSNKLAELSGSIYNTFYYNWPFSGDFTIRHRIKDSNNEYSDYYNVPFTITQSRCRGRTGSGIAGGGFAGGIRFPKIRINNIEEKEKLIKIKNINNLEQN